MTGLMLARAAGARTIITSSSDEKLKLAREKYGSDYSINYKTAPDWASEVNKITEGKGVDVILENGGAGTLGQSLECIARGGMISIIGFLAATDKMPDVAGAILGKGCVVRGINVGGKPLTEDMVAFVTSKGLDVPVEKEFGFSQEEVVEAYKYLESGGHVGKIAIVIKK